MSMQAVEIVEVAPRDGFQAVKPFIATERKIAIIEDLAACGVSRLEIGSFVSPKAVPQLADTGEVLQRAKVPAGLRLQVLVPNAKGLERALEAAWAALGPIKPKLRFGLSTCFDCPWEGRVPETAVIACVERAIAAAPELEIGICDTTGRAAPDHVASLFALLMRDYASARVRFAYHGHDTYGLGVANAIEAYRQGVRVFDGATGGLGGCPFAPGAAGNTASEDLVFAFEHMGVATGVDFARLLAAAEKTAAVAPEQAGGKLRSVPRRRALSG